MSGTPIFEQLCQELIDEGDMECRPQIPDGTPPRIDAEPDVSDESAAIEPDVRLIDLEPRVIDVEPRGTDGNPHAHAPENTARQYEALRWRLWPAQHDSMTLTG